MSSKQIRVCINFHDNCLKVGNYVVRLGEERGGKDETILTKLERITCTLLIQWA